MFKSILSGKKDWSRKWQRLMMKFIIFWFWLMERVNSISNGQAEQPIFAQRRFLTENATKTVRSLQLQMLSKEKFASVLIKNVVMDSSLIKEIWRKFRTEWVMVGTMIWLVWLDAWIKELMSKPYNVTYCTDYYWFLSFYNLININI